MSYKITVQKKTGDHDVYEGVKKHVYEHDGLYLEFENKPDVIVELPTIEKVFIGQADIEANQQINS